MPSSYLTSDDFSTYGLPSSTTTGQVTQASTLIDLYLKRPEGLVWSPDGTGAPGWMSALSPSITYQCAGPISPGQNVTVELTGGVASINVGDVLILDRANAGIAEPVAVVSFGNGLQSIAGVTPPVQVTLQNVVFEHPGPCTLDAGMVLKQHKFMPDGRPVTNLAYTPIARLLAGQGRYGYGRRGASSRYQVDEFNLLASLSHFGGPPVWEFFPMVNTGVDSETGQIWVPAGVMLAYYSEINLWYLAGYPASGIPAAIKMACANVIQAQASVPQLGAVKSYKAGDTALERFAATLLDDDTKAMLAPFRAKAWA
ncbi:hypothetical protein F4827_003083 [Paraburkholderia bannensis]|uniref:Uncharacterized protein n=1 Tax=Paraburkholderia bannensis TaxID=765414 RepID=A0A7W9WTX3_9BURK|nr:MULTISPECIES: hypothetical protein [Paraburkholderia]MBB3258215.1 hypothetical protein [Paraburkholderia sp. WP4_3_2]MBB6103228.1 hypothetical protein [Paraburkholderia bannensis]